MPFVEVKVYVTFITHPTSGEIRHHTFSKVAAITTGFSPTHLILKASKNGKEVFLKFQVVDIEITEGQCGQVMKCQAICMKLVNEEVDKFFDFIQTDSTWKKEN